MENEIEKKQETALAATQPIRRGFEEDTDPDDLIIPRAKLLQALSPEVDEDPARFQQGMIINSLTKSEFPMDEEKRITIIPVLKRTHWIRFNPRDKKSKDFDPQFEAGDIIWRSDNPLDPRVQAEGKFSTDGTPPKATKFIEFLAYVPGTTIPVLVSFSKTSFKAGKELLSLTQFADADMFAFKYYLKSKKETGDNGVYYVLKVQPAGKVDEKDFKIAEDMWKRFHKKNFKVDEVNAEDVEASERPKAEEAPAWTKEDAQI